MRKSWPFFSEAEQKKVQSILKTGKINYWTGNEGKMFEKEFARSVNVNYAIAVSNGTVALELALKAINIKKNDEVIVPSCTYVATAGAVMNLKGKPVFADIDIDTLNVTAETIDYQITKKTKAIIVVHLGGCPCDMDPIIRLAKKRNLRIIEDCSQAHGAKYKNRSVGSFGDLSTWSFCQDKIISTGGEGGMVTTKIKKYRDFIWRQKDHGKSEKQLINQEKKIGFKWIHDYEGSNHRLTEIQSAIGRIQLKNLNKTNESRKNFSHKIYQILNRYSDYIRIPKYSKNMNHAWYRCYVFLKCNKSKTKKIRDELMVLLNKNDIPCLVGSCAEIYLEKVFKKNNIFKGKRHRNAQVISNSSLAFIIIPHISSKEMNLFCKKLDNVLGYYFNRTK
tara:strand:- start:2078 stop:3253 length:1176 start_codon:yes stop_codon:yes gene_type:complete